MKRFCSRFLSRKGTSLTVALGLACWALGTVYSAEAGEKDFSPTALEFFEREIRPTLVENCSVCHSGEQAQGGLRLDFRGGWEQGGKSGPAIVPGDPDGSLLIRAIRQEGPELPMPLGGELPPAVIQAFEQWVRMGAPDPRDTASPVSAADESWEEAYNERRGWWSLQSVVRPPVPNVEQAQWSRQAVARLILAELEANGLSPAPRADRSTLLRRLSYVLTGLPPSTEEVKAFLSDPDPSAYSAAVDRLLASPHFGERWARHWMDVVRYTDTYGYEWDIPAKGSWRYRDYLIRAFNNDVPFDQLVREQIAGDLLPHPRINASEQINESLLGPMFFQMGEKRHADSLSVNGVHQEMLDNKIDAFSKAFQAMTVACARCHDHKFDAVSQRDYYALAGVFMSSRWVTNTLDTSDRNRQVLDQLSALKSKLREPLAGWWLEAAHDIPRYLLAAQARIGGEEAAGRLAEGLKPERLGAWEKAIRFEPDEAEPEVSDEKAAAEERESEAAEEEATPEPTLEDVLFPWLQLHQSAKQGSSVNATWSKLAQDYRTAQRERSESNAQDFSPLADFRQRVPEGWSTDGVGLQDGPVSSGDFTVALDGEAAVGMLLPAGLFTHALSPRLNGALRSPFLNSVEERFLTMEVNGGDYSTRRLLVDNAFLTEREWAYLDDDELHWVCHTTDGADKSERPRTDDELAEARAHVEFTTKTLNPYFPPRVGLGGCDKDKVRVDNCGAEDPNSWFGVTRAFLVKKGEVTNYGVTSTVSCVESVADELKRFESLFSGGAPTDLEGVASRYGQWLKASLEAWARDEADEDDVGLINWMLQHELLPNEMEATESIRELVSAYRRVEARLLEPQTVNGMADLDLGRDYRVNVRGVYEDLGEVVPRGHVEVLRANHNGQPSGSGRLELAELVASRDNPLTARVLVNRVWHWVFGSGIVRTPNDFGHLGDQPSHPQLLDYLADEFVQNGWSVKQLVRSLVLSQTFQQSGQTQARALEVDPHNRLLHHMGLRRLDAESIRDSLLAVSGGLDRKLYGRPINPYRSSEDPTKRLFSGPLDGQGRRSIYLKMTIMEPPRFLATFNLPDPKIPTGSRDITNVPAQALALLNDPFVAQQAQVWARDLIEAGHGSPEQRLREMFQRALGREPEREELTRWVKAIQEIADLYGKEVLPLMQSARVWTDAAHALFNSKEFIYVR